MNKKIFGYALAIFAALGAVNAQGQQILNGDLYGAITTYVTTNTQINSGDSFRTDGTLITTTNGSLVNHGSLVAGWGVGPGLGVQIGIQNFGTIYNDGGIGLGYPSFENYGSFTNALNAEASGYGSFGGSGTVTNLGVMHWNYFNSSNTNNSGYIFAQFGLGLGGTNSGRIQASGDLGLGNLNNSGEISGGTTSIGGHVNNSLTGSILTGYTTLGNSTINNLGVFSFGYISSFGSSVYNSGTINILDGGGLRQSNLHNSSGAILNIGPSPTPFILDDNQSQVINDGILNNSGFMFLKSGSFQGNGTVNNQGQITSDGGSIKNMDSLNETLTSTLSFNVDSTGSHGTFTANHVNLDGTLELDLTNYTPTLGETIRLILAHDFTGAFTNYRVLGKPQFTLTTNVVSLTNGSYAFDVNIVPIPASVWMLLSGLGGLGLMSRKRKI